VLWIHATSVTDLTPLRGMPLEEIRLTPKNITRGVDILRDMKGLKTIGIEWNQSWPAAEFWKRYDKGEFAQAMSADRRAAEYVLSIGGTVKVNSEDKEIKAATELPREAFRLTSVSFRENQRVTDAGLGVFKGCKNLTYLDLFRTQVSDAGLARFKDCKDLTYLDLWETKVTDEGLVHFKDCKSLTGLGLSGTQVTDAGLAHFKDCKSLTVLHLAGTQVSDTGLAHVKDRKNLTRLFLDSTQVTDAGLADLAGLDKLTELNLANTKVTAEGVGGLAKALSKCKITWDGGVIEPK
jgi:Leucine-rich repeat (LRR) protein